MVIDDDDDNSDNDNDNDDVRFDGWLFNNGFALFCRNNLKPQGAPYLVRIIARIFYS
jgi:hypothetical protein